uniref:translation initiation factor 1 n=1 Tax=Coelastrum microporum TaxID=55409 RepID=UPI00226CB1A1|nr:translation initiation factor 1 [Coelastrum microporum]UWM13073.1 translation initiation factor 1 [Coelastrum microporum]
MNQLKKIQTGGKEDKNLSSSSQFPAESSLTKKTKQKKQKKLVDMEGFVTHNLSNGKFRLKLENGVEVIGHLSGKIRQNRIKIVVGDKVTVELSPYDLTKGRITYRHR